MRHIGIPPIDSMSAASLEKRIRELFDSPEYVNKVYIKRIQGGKNVACLSSLLTQEIELNNDVQELIQKQIKKAERNQLHTIEWIQYIREKEFIKMMDGKNQDTPKEYRLTETDKIYCMMEALFSLFFTDYDFELLNQDINEYDILTTTQDFGERYKYLDALLNSPCFSWKYCKPKVDGQLLDVLAERIADTILKRIDKGLSQNRFFQKQSP